jgi:hypothetical protein
MRDDGHNWPTPSAEDLAVLSRRCRWVERAARVAAAIAVIMPGSIMMIQLSRTLTWTGAGEWLESYGTVGVLIGVAMISIPVFAWGLGAWWAVRWFGLQYAANELMERRECFGCAYSLVGLPVKEVRVRCPECGYASLAVEESFGTRA